MKNPQKKKVIVVLGQTATGKSDLAVKLANKFKGEVISADSRQVYKKLDIGTGKITKEEMKGTPHHLLDVADPKKKFTVVEYKKLADQKIEEIFARGKTPIIVGGTGFYIDAVTKGIVLPEVPPNPKLRKTLETKSPETLFKILLKLDKARAENIDPKNKIRLIRAIEIAKAIGKVPKITEETPIYDFIKIGLHLPTPELTKKIEKRVKKMFDDGLLKEVKKLKLLGVSKKRLQELGFEYFEPTYEKVVSESVKYAKRQMTWFKRDPSITWHLASPSTFHKILAELKRKL